MYVGTRELTHGACYGVVKAVEPYRCAIGCRSGFRIQSPVRNGLSLSNGGGGKVRKSRYSTPYLKVLPVYDADASLQTVIFMKEKVSRSRSLVHH